MGVTLFDDASLVLIPSGIKASKVYSVKPEDGTGDLTFTRASIATRTNSAGLIEKVRTNLVLRSEEFENTYWTSLSLNVSVSSNVVAAPNGTNTADLIVADAITSNTIYVRNGVTLPSTGIYTFSVYAKKQNQNTIGLRSLSSGTLINYDLDAETSTGGFIQNVGGGWFRIGFSYTAASTSESIYIYPLGTGTRTGNGVDGVYVWGAQLEAAEAVSDYIPTTTAAVTVGPTNNVPRLDYSGGATCPRLLLEPQRTNTLTYSEAFDNAAWTKVDSTITANDAVSPDGSQNADKLVESATTAAHYLRQSYSFTSGVTYTISGFFKADTRTSVWLVFGGATLGFPSIDYRRGIFNLSNGTVTASPIGGTANIEAIGTDGWYRCSVTITVVNGANANYDVYLPDPADPTSNTYTGDGTSGIYIYGAQLEIGSYPTSYIPTTTAAVTRLADSFSKSGIASLIGQTGGVIMMDFYYDVALTTGTELLFIRNGLSNYIYRARIGSNGPNIFSVLYNNSGSGRALTNSITLVPNNRYKIAVVYDYATNTAKTFINGVLNQTVIGVDPFPTNSQDTLSIGDVLGATQLKLNQLYLSTEIFSDAAAIQLTTL